MLVCPRNGLWLLLRAQCAPAVGLRRRRSRSLSVGRPGSTRPRLGRPPPSSHGSAPPPWSPPPSSLAPAGSTRIPFASARLGFPVRGEPSAGFSAEVRPPASRARPLPAAWRGPAPKAARRGPAAAAVRGASRPWGALRAVRGAGEAGRWEARVGARQTPRARPGPSPFRGSGAAALSARPRTRTPSLPGGRSSRGCGRGRKPEAGPAARDAVQRDRRPALAAAELGSCPGSPCPGRLGPRVGSERPGSGVGAANHTSRPAAHIAVWLRETLQSLVPPVSSWG